MKSNTYNRFAFCFMAALIVNGPIVNAGQPQATQDVCVGPPTGQDVFSVGELRASILSQTPFQELNGAEWVLADGRPLLVHTALSPHLSQESEYGLVIPDVRGRFLRMANNNVCADLRDDEEAHGRCIASRDSDGDRLLGTYQADAFGRHDHGSHGHDFRDAWYSEAWGDGPCCTTGSADTDGDNRHYNKDSRTADSTIPASGGPETRPKNIAVNYYIKICNCRTPTCR